MTCHVSKLLQVLQLDFNVLLYTLQLSLHPLTVTEQTC